MNKENRRKKHRRHRRYRKRRTHEEHKVLKVVLSILLVIFVGFLFLLYFSVRWALNKWGNLTTEEMIFTITSPLKGTGQGMIGEYFTSALLPAAGLLLIVIVLLVIAAKFNKKVMYRSVVCVALVCALFLGGYQGAYHFWTRLDLGDYIYNQNHPSNFIESHYVNPKTTELTFPEKKRNVIYIFMESMEQTYMDPSVGGKHSENLIPEMTKLAQENESFSDSNTYVNGAIAMTGNTWTTGGMFAATSGLPLVKPANSTTYSTNGTDYYPQIKNIGDILHEQNYNQTLLIGSEAAFGYRDVYFKQHGNYEIDDYNYAKKVGWIKKNYHVFWGYEDEKLYSNAKKKLSTLSSSSQPFNLTMLTVDTHFPNGYKCRLCKKQYKTQYENVMACASRQISSFIEWCQTQSWYNDTTIVISGDHPTMNSQICKGTPWDERRVYTCYINSAVTRANHKRRTFTTQDNFPTTLAAMGVKIKGDRLGLGTNLFSDTPTLIEKYGYASLNAAEKRKSDWMYKMMQPAETVASLQKKGKLPILDFRISKYKPGDKTVKATITKATIPDQNQSIKIVVSYRSDGSYGGEINIKNPKVGKSYKVDVSAKSFVAGVKRNQPKSLKGTAYADYDGKQYRINYILGKIKYPTKKS